MVALQGLSAFCHSCFCLCWDGAVCFTVRVSVIFCRAARAASAGKCQSVSILACIQAPVLRSQSGHLLGLGAVLLLSFSSGGGDLGLSSISSVFCSEAPFTGAESGKHTFKDGRLNMYIAVTALLGTFVTFNLCFFPPRYPPRLCPRI